MDELLFSWTLSSKFFAIFEHGEVIATSKIVRTIQSYKKGKNWALYVYFLCFVF